MEILIVGIALVALMFYVSTRVKRSAAQAFEKESVETADLSLIKPEGFLHVLNCEPGLAFQAYSKELGKGDTGNKRKATVELKIITDETFNKVCGEAAGKSDISSNKVFQLDGMRSRSFEVMRSEAGVEFVDHFYIVESPRGIFRMLSSILAEYNAELSDKVIGIEKSLVIKK